MRSVLAVVDLPWPIFAGWIVFLAWAAVQLVWYRRARFAPVAVVRQPAPPRRTSLRASRRPNAADTIADTLPAIDLDSMADTSVIAPPQTVLGL
jgi:hypothetical protein